MLHLMLNWAVKLSLVSFFHSVTVVDKCFLLMLYTSAHVLQHELLDQCDYSLKVLWTPTGLHSPGLPTVGGAHPSAACGFVLLAAVSYIAEYFWSLHSNPFTNIRWCCAILPLCQYCSLLYWALAPTLYSSFSPAPFCIVLFVEAGT